LDEAVLIKKAKDSPGLIGRDLVKEVTCQKPYQWGKKEKTEKQKNDAKVKGAFKVVAIDCGMKTNIVRMLDAAGCEVTIVPAHTRAEEILNLNADGVLLSNGPGDPAAVTNVIETVQTLIGKLPIFGICLGHQILGLALGGKTYKLKFGHRGGNQPVKDLATGKVSITSQNHGFCVELETLNKDEIKLTHINLNDHTLEGMRHKKHPIFSVQYHPEASPGPHDASYLFEEFIHLMERWKGA
jgi:carbamoyl-phosphate synthase small subunit